MCVCACVCACIRVCVCTLCMCALKVSASQYPSLPPLPPPLPLPSTSLFVLIQNIPIPTMETGAEVAKRFYKELTDIQVRDKTCKYSRITYHPLSFTVWTYRAQRLVCNCRLSYSNLISVIVTLKPN